MSNRGFVRAALAAAGSLLVVVAPAADAPVRRTRVVPSEPAARFGNAVALDGPTLVVGARESGESGEVIVLERSALDPDRWAQVARFAQDGLNEFDFFGAAVAVSGNAFLVATDSLGANPGAWVYQRNDLDGTWTEIQELHTGLGWDMVDPAGVAIHGNIAAVGDPGDNASSGAVYLFNRFNPGATRWHLTGRLIPGALPGSRFGTSVAFDGQTLVAGAIGDGALGEQAGAAYVYKRVPPGEGPPWVQVARLAPADLHPFARFGSSVDVAGDTIVVGARGKVLAGVSAGAAYVFERDLGGADNWGLAARLDPTNFDNNDAFGGSVAVRGDRVLVGAPGDDDLCPENPDPEAPDCNHGAAYFFHRVPGGAGVWALLQKFYAPQGVLIHDTEQFGEAVDLDQTSAVVGGPGRDNAYVYRLLFPPP